MNIEQTIREFLIVQLRENGFHGGIGNDEPLIDAKIMDSLGILATISFLEEKFGIICDENELNPMNFKSVNTISKFVKNKLSR